MMVRLLMFGESGGRLVSSSGQVAVVGTGPDRMIMTTFTHDWKRGFEYFCSKTAAKIVQCSPFTNPKSGTERPYLNLYLF